jgi:hypothetical protein
VYRIQKPDFILTIITSVPGQDTIQEYVNKLMERFPQAKILLSGSQVIGQDLVTNDNTMIFNKMDEFIEFVEENS